MLFKRSSVVFVIWGWLNSPVSVSQVSAVLRKLCAGKSTNGGKSLFIIKPPVFWEVLFRDRWLWGLTESGSPQWSGDSCLTRSPRLRCGPREEIVMVYFLSPSLPFFLKRSLPAALTVVVTSFIPFCRLTFLKFHPFVYLFGRGECFEENNVTWKYFLLLKTVFLILTWVLLSGNRGGRTRPGGEWVRRGSGLRAPRMPGPRHPRLPWQGLPRVAPGANNFCDLNTYSALFSGWKAGVRPSWADRGDAPVLFSAHSCLPKIRKVFQLFSGWHGPWQRNLVTSDFE